MKSWLIVIFHHSNQIENSSTEERKILIKLKVDNAEVSVVWENNAATQALMKRIVNEPIHIYTQRYDRFEQVGKLPFPLPRDSKKTGKLGDIMLYQGDHIVIFFGEHSWSYTKLGSIQGIDADEIAKLLDMPNAQVELTAGDCENKPDLCTVLQ